MRTRITDSDRVKLENSEVFVAFRKRSKLGILTVKMLISQTVNV